MGELDQFAKATFALDTAEITRGAIEWEGPKEVGLTEVRLDGLLSVRAPHQVVSLPAPWRDASRHVEVVVEIKMPGEHLDPLAIRRADLRRAAWHVQRTEKEGRGWEGSVGLWLVAPHVPEVLSRLRPIHVRAPGCYAVGDPTSPFLWIAANELPLREPLIPFLIARSGKPLVELARWLVGRRSPHWIFHMLQSLPMDDAARWEILDKIRITNPSPALREQRRWLGREMLKDEPELREEVERDGALVEARKVLRRVLARRGLAARPEQDAQIEACGDLPTVERWIEQAVTAASTDEALA